MHDCIISIDQPTQAKNRSIITTKDQSTQHIKTTLPLLPTAPNNSTVLKPRLSSATRTGILLLTPLPSEHPQKQGTLPRFPNKKEQLHQHKKQTKNQRVPSVTTDDDDDDELLSHTTMSFCSDRAKSNSPSLSYSDDDGGDYYFEHDDDDECGFYVTCTNNDSNVLNTSDTIMDGYDRDKLVVSPPKLVSSLSTSSSPFVLRMRPSTTYPNRFADTSYMTTGDYNNNRYPHCDSFHRQDDNDPCYDVCAAPMILNRPRTISLSSSFTNDGQNAYDDDNDDAIMLVTPNNNQETYTNQRRLLSLSPPPLFVPARGSQYHSRVIDVVTATNILGTNFQTGEEHDTGIDTCMEHLLIPNDF